MADQDEASLAAVRDDLVTILGRLDELGLHQAGAHVSMAVHGPWQMPTHSLPAGRAEAPD
ncbi:MAG TPA: hypothetical protein VF631_09960 [Allosphingosinicella sp.]|uniref:hypothetical protein n=1 Tax=Allosphingosinicella sp. TaxID=2823234 RepID=UPI002F29A908